jgi:signal transduction histidine kinase
MIPQKRTLRILAAPRILQGEFIEVVVPEAPLKTAMWAYATQTLRLSVLVSIATGALVFWTLARQIVFPIRRLTGSIEAFRAAPEDETRTIKVSGRTDEIGRAEAALADMEQELRGALRSRERLAQLGGAVARINHDLRNTLAAAQIVSERLAQSQDPKVRQAAPRLERALERAIGLAEATLRYGRAEEPAPVLDLHEVRPLLEDAAREALEGHRDIAVDLSAPIGLLALADADYVHRILLNLLRNAAQALAGRPDGALTLSARPARDAVIITLADNGPGVPPKVQERLFQPFASGNRAGGAGLGLAIARELARTLGGDLRLTRTGPAGTEFQLRLPSAGAANAPPLAVQGDA